MAMDQIIRHGIEFVYGFDEKSKNRIKKEVRGIFTDGAKIDFTNPENLQGLRVLGDMMSKIFARAGETKFDFEKIMGVDNATQMFEGLKEAAMEFDAVWDKLVANMSSFSVKDLFMREAGDISQALRRMSDKKGNIVKQNVRFIQQAFESIDTSDQNKLFEDLKDEEGHIKTARSWEERTAAALRYANIYEKILKVTKIDGVVVNKKYQGYAERSLNPNNKVAGIYSVGPLIDAIPQMQTSLQNILNMAMGKALIGLTDGGVIDVNVSPVAINKLDVDDLFNKKIAGGEIGVSVVPEVDPSFVDKLSKLWGLNQNKNVAKRGTPEYDLSWRAYNEYFDEILLTFPENKRGVVETRLNRFLKLKNLTESVMATVWRDIYNISAPVGVFGVGDGTGTGTGGGAGSGDASSAAIESLHQQLEDANRKREGAELAERIAQDNATAERHATDAAIEEAETYHRAMDSMQEEMDSLREQLANSGHGTGDGFAPLFPDGTPLDEKEVAMVAKYLGIMKKKMGENYKEAGHLKAALDLVFDIKHRNIENMMGRFVNGNDASNAVLKMATGMEVNNQKNRDAALRSIDEAEYDRIVDEQKAAMSEDKTEFQRKWEELVSAMIGEDAFKNEGNLAKGKIVKAFEELGGTAKEGIDKVNKMWLAGELEGKQFKNKYIQAYVDHLNNEKEHYDRLKDSKAGDFNIDGLFDRQSDLRLTAEKAQALREQAAAYEELIAKKKEYYGIDKKNKIKTELESFKAQSKSLSDAFEGNDKFISKYLALVDEILSGSLTADKAVAKLQEEMGAMRGQLADVDAGARVRADEKRNELAKEMESYDDDEGAYNLKDLEAQKKGSQEILNTLEQEDLLTDEIKANYDAGNTRIQEKIALLRESANLISSLKEQLLDATKQQVSVINGSAGNVKETMRLVGAGGVFSAVQGEDYSIDAATMVKQLVSNLKNSIIMSLHDHPNAMDAFTPADVESFAKLYYDQGSKINGIIANGVIKTIDFTGISKELAIKIAQSFAENVSMIALKTGKFSFDNGNIALNPKVDALAQSDPAEYQKIVDAIIESIDVSLDVAFRQNGLESTVKTFTAKQLPELTQYLLEIQKAGQNAVSPVERLKSLLVTIKPDQVFDWDKYEGIFRQFESGAIDGFEAINQISKQLTQAAQPAKASLEELYNNGSEAAKKAIQDMAIAESKLKEFNKMVDTNPEPRNQLIPLSEEEKANFLNVAKEYQNTIKQINDLEVVADTEDDKQRLIDLKTEAIKLHKVLRQAYAADGNIYSYIKDHGLLYEDAEKFYDSIRDLTPQKFIEQIRQEYHANYDDGFDRMEQLNPEFRQQMFKDMLELEALMDKLSGSAGSGTDTDAGQTDGATSAEVANLQKQLADKDAELASTREKLEAAKEAASYWEQSYQDENVNAYDYMTERDELREKLAKTQGVAGSSESTINTSDEQQQLTKLKGAVSDVTDAVKEKTQEFLNEQSAVKKAAQSEVHALGEVEKKVNAIRAALGNVNTLLNNIKKGKDIGAGLSNININVNYKKDDKEDKPVAINQEQLKSTLEKITYNVKIAHSDTDKNANKVAIDAADLEGVLRKVFSGKPGDTDKVQSEKQLPKIDSSAVKTETDALIEQYRRILSTIEEWKTLYAQLQTIQSSSTADFRKQMLPMLENMSPELVKMIGGSFAENFAKGFKGVKTKDILGALGYIVNSDLFGNVTDQVDMLSKIDFSKFSFEGLEIKETNIDFLKEAFELLKQIDAKNKEIAGIGKTEFSGEGNDEPRKESYALENTLQNVARTLTKIQENTASLKGIRLQQAVDANTDASRQVAATVEGESKSEKSAPGLSKEIERRKGEDEVLVGKGYVYSEKTDRSYRTTKRNTRIDYDDDGAPVEITEFTEIIDDYDKIRKESDKTKKTVERAQKKVDEFVAKFDSKTGGNAKFIDGFGELSGFKVTADNIDIAYNKMIMLQQKYAELEKNFRKGQSSLNPFVNAINKAQNIDNLFGETEKKFDSLTVKSESLADNFVKLADLSKKIKDFMKLMGDNPDSITPDMFMDFSKWMGEFTSIKTRVDGLIKSKKMEDKNLVKDYEELGRLRAKFEGSGDLEDREELKILAEKVAKKREAMKLTSAEIRLLRAKSDEAYKEEQRRIEAAERQAAINKANTDAARAEKTAAAEQSARIKEWVDLSKRLGELDAKINSGLFDDAAIEQAKEERDFVLHEIDEVVALIDDPKVGLMDAEKANLEGHYKAINEQRSKMISGLVSKFEELGQLQAKSETPGAFVDRERHEQLQQEIADEVQKLGLNEEQSRELAEILQTHREIAYINAKDVEYAKEQKRLYMDYAKLVRRKGELDGIINSELARPDEKIVAQRELKLVDEEINYIWPKLKLTEEDYNTLWDTNIDVEAQGSFAQWKKGYREYIELLKEIAKLEAQSTEASKERAKALWSEVYEKQELLALSEEEILASGKVYEDAYRAEQDRLKGKKAGKDAADAKRMAKRQAMFGKAGSAIGRAESVWLESEGLEQDKLPDSFKKQIDKYYDAIDQLRLKHHEINTSEVVTDEQQAELIEQTKLVNGLTEKVGGLVTEYQKLSGANVDETKARSTTLTGKSSLKDYEAQLRQYVKSITDGKAQIKNFNAETKTLTYTVKTGKNEFTEYTAAVRHLDHQMVSVQGTTKRTETFFEATKRKMKEISSYMSGMTLMSRAGQELKRGIQYVKEIDLAMTELKKVTNETDETYDKFLDTAAKTADKVGSTIQKVISSTADWARLNI